MLEGHALTEQEALSLLEPVSLPLADLMHAAKTLTRRRFGNALALCAIHAAKVGRCGGDCAFCAQSKHSTSAVQVVRVQESDPSAIAARALELRTLGVARFSLVTSGERLTPKEFTHILSIYRAIRARTDIRLCASLGSVDEDRARQLAACGVTRYHHNIETARSYFPNICTTHSYDDRLQTIRIARAAGMEICSGGILFMGESARQRVEMALALCDLHVDCVPINILNPIVGTRLASQPLPDAEEVLRALALFRLILPDTTLCFAGGRQRALGQPRAENADFAALRGPPASMSAEYAGYEAGINALLVGDFLTTEGRALTEELDTLTALGYTLG